jgi:hypothetical protein
LNRQANIDSTEQKKEKKEKLGIPLSIRIIGIEGG